jgi:arylsulfatase A-like enzyme
MTGRYPTHSGLVVNWVNASPLQNPHCLANVFAAAGYDTGFIGKWHLAAGIRVANGPYGPKPQAEQAYLKDHPNPEHVPPGPARLGFNFWQAYNFHTAYNNYWYYEDAPQKIYSKRYETDVNIDQAIDYIEKHKNLDKPFLLVVAPHPPHPPFAQESLPEGYLDKIPSAKDLFHPPNVPKENNPMQPEQWRMYLAMAKNFDDNLGRLMDYLDRSNAGQDTILVFTADHGEMGGSHGRINKMVPYAEATNVPLRMRWLGKIPAGVTSDALYTPMDHLPTLCGLAGLNAPSEADGEDLSEVVLGRGRSLRDAVLMTNLTSHWDYFQTGTLWPEWRGVHTNRYTYVKWLAGQEELYDNLEDPYQMHNLVGEESAKIILLELRWQMKELMISAHDQFLSGEQYAAWYDADRNLVRTGLGPARR